MLYWLDTQFKQNIAQYIFLFILFISVAALNGFPLYFADSAGYAGHPDRMFDLRSVTPGLVAYPLYQIAGVWALPIINSAALAFVLVRFLQVLKIEFHYIVVFVAVFATSVPLMTSYITPDIWFLIQVMCIVMLLIRWSVVDFILASIAVTGHGANFPLLLAMMPFAFLFFGFKMRVLNIFLAVILTSVLILAIASKLTRGEFFPETLAGSILGSKVLNDVPSALESLCRDAGHEPICVRRHLVEDGTSARDDDTHYLNSAIGDPNRGGLTREQFNAVGYKLFKYAILEYPLVLLKETLRDFGFFFTPERYTIHGYTDDQREFIRFIVAHDRGRFIREWIESPSLKITTFILNSTAIALSIFLCLLYLKDMTGIQRAAFGLVLSAWILNDLVFALLSGPPARYHIRMLGIFVPIALLGYNLARDHWRMARA